MKKYICIKTVMARQLSKWQAYDENILEPGTVVTDEDQNVQGYEVINNENGLHEWIPKEDFEKEHRLADTPLDRMRIEIADLVDKTGKLSRFIQSERFKSLDTDMQGALRKQFHYMGKYEEALSSRIGMMMMGQNKKTESNGE